MAHHNSIGGQCPPYPTKTQAMTTTTRTVLCAFTTLALTSIASADDKTDEQKKIEELKKRIAFIEGIVDSQDVYFAFEQIEQGKDPIAVVREYMMISRRYYSQHKDVPMMTMFARAGIQFALNAAKTADPNDKKLATSLRAHAKSFAFNTSANNWPGWQDPGIAITKSDLANGLDLARLNLRLAKTLKANEQAQLNAHWLLGVHLMAAGKSEPAVEQFKLARESAPPKQLLDYVGMVDGYAALARLAATPNDAELRGKLKEAIARLSRTKGEGKFFAAQIKTAAEVFAPESK